MNKFLLILVLCLTTELISQNNPELFELKLNVSNIESNGNLVIAVWSNPDSWNSNATNSSGQKEGFDYLDAPIRRITAADAPLHYAPNLVTAALPDVPRTVKLVKEVMYQLK